MNQSPVFPKAVTAPSSGTQSPRFATTQVPVIGRSWFSGLRAAAQEDKELQIVGRYSNFWIDTVCEDHWRIPVNFREGRLEQGQPEQLPPAHIIITATAAGWAQLFDQQPRAQAHDLLSLAKNSPHVTISGSNIELLRNLRVIHRLVDLGKEMQ